MEESENLYKLYGYGLDIWSCFSISQWHHYPAHEQQAFPTLFGVCVNPVVRPGVPPARRVNRNLNTVAGPRGRDEVGVPCSDFMVKVWKLQATNRGGWWLAVHPLGGRIHW